MQSTMKTEPINRREFLYYLFGGSVLVAAPAGALLFREYLRVSVDYRYIEGVFLLDEFDIPLQNGMPIHKAGFAVSHIDGGLLALSVVCPLRRANVRWSRVGDRFACPACGSKFTREGAHIEGPAQRQLDRYVIRVDAGSEYVVTPEDGSPVNIADSQAIFVDTRYLIRGAERE